MIDLLQLTSSTHLDLPQTGRANKPPAADAAADVAVFRFTLGIPGLDDAQVPRIIGALALAGLAANRVFGGGIAGALPAASQGRAEAAAAVLALACVALPSIEALIADAEPGRGRGAVAALPGTAQAFRVASAGGERKEGEGGGEGSQSSLQEDGGAAAAELAWSSYALLRNANCCTVVVLAIDDDDDEKSGGRKAGTRALAVRGALPPAVARAADPLAAAAAAFSSSSSSSSLFAAAERGEAFYVSDASSMTSAGSDGGAGGRGPWGVLPPGAGCALAQPIHSSACSEATGGAAEGGGGGGHGSERGKLVGLLLLAGDRPRALSVRDRAWARSVARKLSPVVAGVGAKG